VSTWELNADTATRGYERNLAYLLHSDPDFAFEYAVMGEAHIRATYPPLRLQEYAVIHSLNRGYTK
jgi:hypothetical protein